ncbi:MAG TPA: DUF2892 domain-containing protein [Planctomycetaceae bacterium]|nr:DUF2892 domain-containing protein [Planctomycetaceae bacterium]
MKTNLGKADRTIRVVAGVGLLVLAFVGPQTPWGYLGLVPILTGVIGFCPACCPLGLSSCRVPKKQN